MQMAACLPTRIPVVASLPSIESHRVLPLCQCVRLCQQCRIRIGAATEKLDVFPLLTDFCHCQRTDFDFQNGPDSVILRQGEIIVDALGYGVFSMSEVFAGEGRPAPDAPPGSSLARLFANLDSDDNQSDFRLLAEPTPGVAAFALVPEPGTSLMLGLGLSGLMLAGRRQCHGSRPTLRPSTRPIRRPIRRNRAWQRRSTGSISARVERRAPERPSFWTPGRS